MVYIAKLTHGSMGSTDLQVFQAPLIRIGRNHLNELVLAKPFVSEWHGLVRFDHDRAVYVDLGSTNGSMIGGRRVEPNTPVPISLGHGTVVEIGPMRLSFAEEAVVPAWMKNRKDAFGGERVSGSVTMQIRSAQEAQGGLDPRSLQDAANRCRPAYGAFQQAWVEVDRQLKARLASVPPADRAELAAYLGRELPGLASTPGFGRLLDDMGIDLGASHPVDPERWLQSLASDGPPAAGAPSLSVRHGLDRVQGLLTAAAEAYVELRRAHGHFLREMGISLGAEENPLEKANDTESVLRFLLDWDQDGALIIDRLRGAYADLGIHQVALLSGIMAGVRELLDTISPQSLETGRGSALAASSVWGKLRRLLPWHTTTLWRRYEEAHRALVAEERYTSKVLGHAFTRAYLNVMGQQSFGSAMSTQAAE